MPKVPTEKALLRVVDANFNRAKEGIRVIEDISRFYLADSTVTGKFRRARHQLSKIIVKYPMKYRDLVNARDSKEDVGRDNKALVKFNKLKLQDLFVANVRRSQEAVRVLEELSKMIAPKQSFPLQRLRFNLYDLEKIGFKKF